MSRVAAGSSSNSHAPAGTGAPDRSASDRRTSWATCSGGVARTRASSPAMSACGVSGTGLRKSGVQPRRGVSMSSGRRSSRSASGRTASSQGRW